MGRHDAVDRSAARSGSGGHHPPHVYLDDAWRMISSGTLNHARFLTDEHVKRLVRDAIRALTLKFDAHLLAWR